MRRSISGWQQHDGQRRRCLIIFSPCSCMIVPATAAVMAATPAPVLVIIASTKTPNKRENSHQLL